MQTRPQALVPLAVGDVMQAIFKGEAQLEDFLDEADYVQVIAATRWRIIREFVEAEFGPQGRATIPGLGEDIDSLAAHLQRQMNERVQRKIFSAHHLPETYRLQASDAVRKFIIRYVVYKLIARQLFALYVVGDLWWVNGEWELRSSVLDEYRRRYKRPKTQNFDDRSYHGRPRRDRDRAYAPGVSIGALA